MWDLLIPEKLLWRRNWSKNADELIVEYLREGKNVANEYSWITREWRDKARKVARKAGFETKVIYIKVPEEEIRKRWLENSQSRGRFHWPKEELERMFVEFEEPSTDENIIYYDSSLPIDKWVEDI